MPRKAKGRRRSPSKAETTQPQEQADLRRRATLRLLRNGAICAAAVGVVGIFSVNAVRATVREQDLTQLGQGIPTIVQIHDPGCALCTSLQRETRRALKSFDDDALNYLVANIKTPEGSGLAARHRAQHVTLLLFDGAGELHGRLEGVRTSDELRTHFRAHLDAHGDG